MIIGCAAAHPILKMKGYEIYYDGQNNYQSI